MKIGIIQLTSSLEYKVNLEKIRHYLAQAKEQNVKAVFLPECFYSLSDGTEVTPYIINGKDEHFYNISKLATDFEMFILGGSATAYGAGEVKNRCYNFSPDGKDLGTYDKQHLFSCDFVTSSGERKIINEGDLYKTGDESRIVQAGALKIGIGICFDLRFPELYREYGKKEVNVITMASAFTIPTGKDHWHVLIRARAIENQCYAIAAAQWGKNNDKISTYGHSLVVDPWGKIILDAGEGEKLVTTELDLEYPTKVRKKIHVF
jgi:deaminated glutathione amidase